MMVVSNEPKLIVSEPNIIYKPIPKKVYNSNMKFSHFSNYSSINQKNRIDNNKNKHKKKCKNWNLNNNKKGKKQNFDLISLEEIENDFKKLKAKSEIVEVENELLKLLELSTKDISFDEYKRKIKPIKRPKNINYKNFE